jgi:hypothetical protein
MAAGHVVVFRPGSPAARGSSGAVGRANRHIRSAGPRATTGSGRRPLAAHCHLGLGKLCAHTNKREQAKEHLTTATTLYREMDMRFWLKRADAELA